LNRRLVRPQGHPGLWGRRGKLLSQTMIRTPDHPDRSIVSVVTELSFQIGKNLKKGENKKIFKKF
jgi:hypothetical protein